MQLRHRAAINDIQLDELDNRIIVQGIDVDGGKTSLTAVSLYGRDGQRVTREQRDSIDVTVQFGLLIRKSDMEARSSLLEAVNTWASAASLANGGAWLTVNYKPGRRIRVILTNPAEEGDLKDWTNIFNLTFRAYGVPYWVEAEPGARIVSPISSAWSGVLNVTGSARTAADVELKNESGALINTATVRIGNSEIGFTDLGLGASERLIIDHDANGYLRIRILSPMGIYRSAMAMRTGGSADDLYAMPGAQTAAVSAQRAVTMTATATGRYL